MEHPPPLAPPLHIAPEEVHPSPPSTNSLGSELEGLLVVDDPPVAAVAAAAVATGCSSGSTMPTTQPPCPHPQTPPSSTRRATPGGQRKFSPAQRMLDSPAPLPVLVAPSSSRQQQHHHHAPSLPPPLHIGIGGAPQQHQQQRGATPRTGSTAPILVIPRHQTPTRASAARGVSPIRCRAGAGCASPVRSLPSPPSHHHHHAQRQQQQQQQQQQQLRSRSPREFGAGAPSSPYAGGGAIGGGFAFPKPGGGASPSTRSQPNHHSFRAPSPAGPVSRQYHHHQQQQQQQRPGSPSYMMATQASALKARAPSPMMGPPAAFGPGGSGSSSRPASRSTTPVKGMGPPSCGSAPASPVRPTRDSSATRRRREAMQYQQHQQGSLGGAAWSLTDGLSKRPRLHGERGAIPAPPWSPRAALRAAHAAPRAPHGTGKGAPVDPLLLARSLDSLSLGSAARSTQQPQRYQPTSHQQPQGSDAAGMEVVVAAPVASAPAPAAAAAAAASIEGDAKQQATFATTEEEIKAVLDAEMVEYREKRRFELPLDFQPPDPGEAEVVQWRQWE